MKRYFKGLIEKLFKNQDGQSSIFLILFVVLLVGIAALVIDLGLYNLSKNRMQTAIDAATLAAVQELPENPDKARALVLNYLELNGMEIDEDDISITLGDENHSIRAVVDGEVSMFFARTFGLQTLNAKVKAKAMVGFAASVPWIVPFVIPQPVEFNFDEVYVMRMYGSGPYPSDYSYPSDYRNDPVYKNYPLVTTNFYTAIGSVNLKQSTRDSSSTLIVIPNNATVKYNYSTVVNNQTWYNITYNNKTGFVKKAQLKFNESTGGIYPYHFDYMNVYIKNNTGFTQYVNWLENGYHDNFTVGETMYYYAPSSGGKTSVDAFAKRVSRDPNTDYTKAKVGDGRVILIPVVQQMLSRNTSDHTPINIIGFTAFYIQEVHKNSYTTSFWFEGRFLKDVEIPSGEITFDPNANFGLKVVKLVE